MTTFSRVRAFFTLEGLLLGTALLSLLLGCFIGATPISLPQALAALVASGEAAYEVIIWQIRFPRAAAAFIVGGALGASGAALQGLLRNPLAEPGVLGVTAAASLGATFMLYYGIVAVSAWFLPLGAVAGALAATTLIAVAAMRTSSVLTLILIGVGLSAFTGAIMSLLMNLAPNPFSLSDMVTWMLGSVANRSWVDIAFALPFIAGGCLVLAISRRGLSVLTLGEEAAESLGLDIRRQRMFVIIGSGLAAGGAVALAGAIGFVGVVAPHIIRPLVGHDPARSLVPSALLAGIILVLADILVRLLPTERELQLGVLAALIGAPIFVLIAAQRGTNGG